MQTKICKVVNCDFKGASQPIENFYQYKSGYLQCKSCRRKYVNNWYLKNKEIGQQRRKKWVEQNPDKQRESQWKYNGLNITFQQYEKLLKKQNGVCAICKTDKPLGKRTQKFPNGSWCVDHNHETGKIRGILCNNCNRCLGMLSDSIELLEKAIEYLRTNS